MKTFNFFTIFLLLFFNNKNYAQTNLYSSDNTLQSYRSVDTRIITQQTNPIINIGYEMNKSVMGGQPNLVGNNTVNSFVPPIISSNNLQGSSFQNYPNPFQEITNIQYQMRNSGPIRITVHDLNGRQLAILVNQNQSAGTYQVDWNGRDYPAGTYIFKIVTNEENITQKMEKTRR